MAGLVLFALLAAVNAATNAQALETTTYLTKNTTDQNYYSNEFLNLVTLGTVNRKKYLFANQRGSWFEASYFCNAHGMDLVTIETQQENDLILEQIVSLGMETAYRFWTGGHKIGRSMYLWENGEYMIFSDWASGEPSNPTTDQCMTIYKSSWYDLICTWVENTSSGEKTAFICEERDPAFASGAANKATINKLARNYYPADMMELVTLGTPGKKYLFANQMATWMEASYFCNAHGMDLVTIETQRENDLIMEHITSLGYTSNRYFWTSGHKIGRSTYLWIQGKNMIYSDWATGNPGTPATEHCMMIHKEDWYDLPCNYLENTSAGIKTSFICEERQLPPTNITKDKTSIITAYYPNDLLNLVSLGPINERKKYAFIDQDITWMEASYFCNAHGMDLITIETEQENDDIMEHLVSNVLDGIYMLTSGHKIGRSTYLWVNGEFFSFTDWASGQPAQLAAENCMALYTSGWHDVNCHASTAAFACEERTA